MVHKYTARNQNKGNPQITVIKTMTKQNVAIPEHQSVEDICMTIKYDPNSKLAEIWNHWVASVLLQLTTFPLHKLLQLGDNVFLNEHTDVIPDFNPNSLRSFQFMYVVAFICIPPLHCPPWILLLAFSSILPLSRAQKNKTKGGIL